MSGLHRLFQYICLLCATCTFGNSAKTSQDESHVNEDYSYYFYQQSKYPRDCKEVQNDCSSSSSSGVYLIKPDGYSEPFEVFCNNNVDAGGWTVVQRRQDGSVSFNRNWKEYKEGFGFLSSEFWLGNDKLSYITNQAAYLLRIDFELSSGSSFYIEYNAFRITDEWSQYSLNSVGGYSGNDSSVITFCPPDTVFQDSACEPIDGAEIFTDCYHAYQEGRREDGVYTIRPTGWTNEPFEVPCNMTIDGGGWTVLQRRVNGSVNFEHNWEEYKNGFGIFDHELWLGNDKIYYLTNQTDYELRMDMVNVLGVAYFAKYSFFRISDENSKYQLELGTYDSASTTTFDSMNVHRDQFFSTPDRDNDRHTNNCADHAHSAWWYNSCINCDFNRAVFGADALRCTRWNGLPGTDCLMYTDIKIRPV